MYVNGEIILESNLNVSNNVTFEKDAEVKEDLYVRLKTYLDADVSMGQKFNVDGDASFNSSVEITDNLYVDNDVSVEGQITVQAVGKRYE